MVSEHIGAKEHRSRFGRSKKASSGPKMAKHFPETKMYGKKRFRLVTSYRTKSEAQKFAEDQRKKGKLIRVVHSLRKHASVHGMEKDHKYAVYIHSKF